MQENLSLWVEALGYVSVALYAWLTLREYRQYRRYINNYFSDTEQIRFVWLRSLLLAMLLAVSVTFLFSVVNVSIVSLDYYQAWYEFLATGILIYFLSIAGLLTNNRLAAPLQFRPAAELPDATAPEMLPETVPGFASTFLVAHQPVAAGAKSDSGPTEPASETAPTAALPDPELTRWATRLTELMTTERPYLAPELTLPELAARLGANTSVVSRVINTGFKQNFNDYINEHRVREAERRLRDPRFRHYTLLAVALESGFNSKSTFNRVFKKLRGTTPSAVAAGLNL